jgi:hypothetical protein
MSLKSLRGPLLSMTAILMSVPLYCQQPACDTIVITLLPRAKAAPPVGVVAPDDLRVKVGGKMARLDSLKDRPTPPRISILLDVGAKQSQLTWATSKRIIDSLVAASPEGTEFALIRFADKVEQGPVMQKDGRSMQDALRTFSLSGAKETKGAMVDAINAATNVFEHPRAGDVEVLLTASEENFESSLQADAERQLSLSHIRLLGISFDSSKLPGPLPTGGVFVNVGTSFSSAEAISRSSGGMWTRTQVASATVADGIADNIARLIASFFVLHLQPEHSLERAEDLKMELLKNRHISPNDILLLYPQKLYPCQ